MTYMYMMIVSLWMHLFIVSICTPLVKVIYAHLPSRPSRPSRLSHDHTVEAIEIRADSVHKHSPERRRLPSIDESVHRTSRVFSVVEMPYIFVESADKVAQEMIVASVLAIKGGYQLQCTKRLYPPKYIFTTEIPVEPATNSSANSSNSFRLDDVHYTQPIIVHFEIDRYAPLACIQRRIVENTDMRGVALTPVCEIDGIDRNMPHESSSHLQALILASEEDGKLLVECLHMVCECIVVQTKAAAMAYLLKTKYRPNIIMISVSLDSDRSDSFILAIRRLWPGYMMHVVVVAGINVTNGYFVNAMTLDANAFLIKPFVKSKVMGVVLEYVQMRELSGTRELIWPAVPRRGSSRLTAGAASVHETFTRRMSHVATIIGIFSTDYTDKMIKDIAAQTGCIFVRVADLPAAIQMCRSMPPTQSLIVWECRMSESMADHDICELEKLRQLDAFNSEALPILIIGRAEAAISHYYLFNDYVLNASPQVEMLTRIERLLVGMKLERGTEYIKRLSLSLLHEIIPQKTLVRMQAGQTIIADSHEHMVCCFVDIIGFTTRCSELDAAVIVNILYELYSAFDNLTDDHNVFKVETIGDAYFVAAWDDDPEMRILSFARAALDAAEAISWPNGDRLKVRIGVSSGAGMSGMFNAKRPRFCMFGDVVNSAARFQTASSSMCIAMSAAVAAVAIKNNLGCVKWKTQHLKGKGDMDIWLLCAGDWQLTCNEPGASDFGQAVTVGYS